MKIHKSLLVNLSRVYRNALGFPKEFNFDEHPFEMALAFIENNLRDHFDWDALSRKPDTSQELVALLKKCLIVADGHMTFDALAAMTSIVAKKQSMTTDSLYLARDIETTGIQEKYLKSQLSSQESLTDLDIRRFIANTGMRDKIQVVNLNIQEVGLVLHEARTKHQDTHQAYSINLVSNIGSEEGSPYPQWMSLSVTVDPTAQTVTYQAHSGIQLSDAQRTTIEETITNAIKFEATSTASNDTYSAFPRIAKITGALVSHDAGKLSGYKALHELYKDESLRDAVVDHDTANKFAKLEDDLKSIKKLVYKVQLCAIQLNEEQAQLLAPNVLNYLELGKIKPDALEQQLKHLGSPISAEGGQHPLVVERISELQLYNTKMSFPGQQPEQPLKNIDYQQFLLLVHEKFKSAGLKKALDEMVVACYDNAALEGLIAYNETNLPVPFQVLTLNIDNLDLNDEQTRDGFLFNLKTLLITMSDSTLSALKLTDTNNQLTLEMIENLAKFISSRPVAIDISLPIAFQGSAEQQLINEVISDNIRQKQIAALGNKVLASKVSKKINENVRTRPKLSGKQTLSIDIELQQEQQVEVAVEASTEKVAGTEALEPGAATIYSLYQFQNALSEGQLDSGAKSYLVDSSLQTITPLWLNWTGALSTTEAITKGIKLSKTACEELLRHQDQFQFGLDLKNLPAGFLLKTEEGRGTYIHFDENFKLIADYNPLQVQTSELPGEKPLAHSLFHKWLQSADEHNPIKIAIDRLAKVQYDKEAYQAIKQFLPKMLLLDQTELTRLFDVCFDQENHFNSQNFRFLLDNAAQLKKILGVTPSDSNIAKTLIGLFSGQEDKALLFIRSYTESTSAFPNHLLNQLIGNDQTVRDKITLLIDTTPNINLNALLQLYTQFGEKGIDELSTLVKTDVELFNQLNTQIFSKTKTLVPVISEEYKGALNAIKGFSREEKTWWNTLLKQHCEAQKDVNLVDLVNAFKAFKKQLKEFPTEDGQPLTFPATCELTEVKSLPVALSRMLTLLGHCNQQNRRTQWEEISKLDLSSTGMIKPVSTPELRQWAFISPEMAINASQETKNNFDSTLTEYRTPKDWKSVRLDVEGTVERNFFRYVAYQEKNAQMPLAFYRHLENTLIHTALSASVKECLYCLLAAATTERKNVETNASLEAAKNDVDNLIKLVIDTPFEMIRVIILSDLTRLKNIPPLPVLNQLLSLIKSCLSNPISMVKNSRKLEQANDDLRRNSDKYGSAIYDGMKDYIPDNYKNENLFYDHMAMLNKLDKELSDRTQATGLMRILSSFQLTNTTLSNILDVHFKQLEAGNSLRQIEALTLLSNIWVKKNPNLKKLTPEDLFSILQAVKDSPEPVVDILKGLKLNDQKALAAYFPEDLLENYGREGIPDDVANKIAEIFHEKQQAQISKILLRFSAPGDQLLYGLLVDKIITISKPLTAIERNIFIAKLTSSLGLYTDKKPLSQEDHYFVKLLDTLIAYHSPDELINLVASERDLLNHSSKEQVNTFFVKPSEENSVIEGLSQKSVLYLQTILPKIKALKNLVISQMDLTPRLHKTLLKTPLAQLTAVSQVTSDKQAAFERQEQAITTIVDTLKNGTKIDFKSAEKATDTFIKTASLDDPTSSEKLRDTLKETGKTPKVKLLERLRVFTNPDFRLLIIYYTKPEALNEEQRDFFEKNYKDNTDKLLEKYPGIVSNLELLPLLQENPEFVRALNEKSVLDAAASRNLLEDNQKLNLVFESMEKDLKSIADFKTRTIDFQQELSLKKAELAQYPTVFVDLYKKMNQIAIENPSSKKQFMELFDRYLEHYSPDKQGELLNYLTEFVRVLETSFAEIKEKNWVLSLCLQFNSDSDPELQPEGLLALLNAVDSVQDAGKKHALLKLAVELINNDKGYTLDSFRELCGMARNHTELANYIAAMYKNAPFPTIEQVKGWHYEAIKSGDYLQQMDAFYTAFDKAPCHREIFHNGKPLNGFHVDKAREQLSKFTGFDANLIDLDAFKAKTDVMRDKTTDELLALIAKYNPKNPAYEAAQAEDYDSLVAAAAELLHRSKGKDDKDSEGHVVLGSSMEINTTQYLAILSSLKTPGHVTSQIGTGEGKTRIMMISNACQFALGKTVDFVTSDVQLATRDFVEFQAYFDMIGAKTSMIFAHTDPSLYQIGGINFSDPSNLSLFRNKARSLGQDAMVLDPIATNRALLLDEADKTYFDVADTRFNFSKEGDDNIRGMEWIYPLLMEYFAQKEIYLTTPLNGQTTISPMDLYYENVDLCREKLIEFASGKCPTRDLMRLKALSNSQVEQWQVSAVTASQLKFKEDFVIEPDVLIGTPSGPKISSEAQLLFSNRVSKSSKFSFGVHQCLHACLNIARDNLAAVDDEKLKTALSQCEQAFYVPDEKQIVYSSTSKNLLDDYAEGTLKAVTGTSGSLIERQEARELYGLKTESTVGKMHFIDIPRDKGIQRKDRAIRLTANHKEQINTLVAQIKEARSKNQPILIIAENDQESELVFKELSQRFQNDQKLQQIHSQLSPKEEKARTDVAGNPQEITVSTDMIGRGTDISLKGKAKEHGLNVMLTYLPRPRDLAQIIGRSGRFGAQGETSLVLDKQRLKKALGKTTLTDGFYKNREAYIEREQALMDRNKQCERLIKNTVGDFRKTVTNYFFEDMLNETDKKNDKQLLPIWTTFFDKSDKAWNELWPHIQKELAKDKIDVGKIEPMLNDYKSNVQKIWNTLRRNVQDTDVVCLDGTKPIDKLAEKLPHLELSAATKKLLTDFDIRKYSKDNWTVYDRYDPGHEGRAVKYSHWSIPLLASLKGYANLLPFVHFSDARRPFANVRAWLSDQGTLFPEFRANKNKSKILGATLLGVLGAAVGSILIATGILAPLGLAVLGLSALVTSAIMFGIGGLIAGAAIGLAGGAVIDAVNNRSTLNNDEKSEEMTPSSYSLMHGEVAEIEPHDFDKKDDLADKVGVASKSLRFFADRDQASKAPIPSVEIDKQNPGQCTKKQMDR